MSGSLFAELKRRNVIRASAAYLALGWVVTQVTSTVAPALRLPDWIVPVVLWIGVIGFPFIVVFSWLFELTSEGLKRESEVAPDDSIRHLTAKRLDRLAIALFALAIALLALDRFTMRGGAPDAAAAKANSPDAAVQPKAGTGSASPAKAVPAADDKSIAVLPFLDLSQAKDQEYFSDGLSEQLLDLLAKVPELKVIARTSSFAFKGKSVGVAEIAKQLAVATVLEGSVRKSGNTLRITAQLIRASDSVHLWSETYDRELTDIFKVQDEIAAAITTALKAKLVGSAAAAARERAIDPGAYDDYLQARRHVALRVGDNLRLAAEAFSRTIEHAPDYAPAYSGRAFAFVLGLGWKPWLSADEALAKGEGDVTQALRLDPDAAEAFMVRGIIQQVRSHNNAALADFEHALKLAPGNVDVMNFVGDYLEVVGALRRAESLKRRAMALDPLAFVHPMNLNEILNDQGRYADAAAMGERAVALHSGGLPDEKLYYAKLRNGDLAGARTALAAACADFGEDNASCQLDRALLLATTGSKDEARALARQAAERPAPEWGGLPPHQLAAGIFSFGLGDYAEAAAQVKASFGGVMWSPTLALLWGAGGARLPEELSHDPLWLAAWDDPRAAELMALYRANIAAFRKGE